MFKLAFFVPETHLEAVKYAVFQAGGGRIGNYDCCAWQVKGIGQFRALEGANPFIGKQNEIEQLDEWKVELVVADHLIKEVIAAMRAAHPYEEPAYDVWKLEIL